MNPSEAAGAGTNAAGELQKKLENAQRRQIAEEARAAAEGLELARRKAEGDVEG